LEAKVLTVKEAINKCGQEGVRKNPIGDEL
jgi:hypothetical protein